MDENQQPINDQNNNYSPEPKPNADDSHDTAFFNATTTNEAIEGVSVDSNFKRPEATISSNISIDRSEQQQNSMRIGLAVISLLFVVGAGVATMYFTKTGFFRDKGISTGNHSFVIDEKVWTVGDVDTEAYSITLYDDNNGVTVGVSDNPIFSTYPYDAQYFKNDIRQLDSKITTSKKTYGDIKCVVYDGTMALQGTNVPFKTAICNTPKNFNVMVGIVSLDRDSMDQYLEKGLEIVKTAK